MNEGFRSWLETLDDGQLVDYRFELYDIAEIAEHGSPMHEFARLALERVEWLEARRAMLRELRNVCAATMPDIDADAFIDALTAIVRAQGELGSPDVESAFRGAFEVAERRAATVSDNEKGND